MWLPAVVPRGTGLFFGRVLSWLVAAARWLLVDKQGHRQGDAGLAALEVTPEYV